MNIDMDAFDDRFVQVQVLMREKFDKFDLHRPKI